VCMYTYLCEVCPSINPSRKKRETWRCSNKDRRKQSKTCTQCIPTAQSLILPFPQPRRCFLEADGECVAARRAGQPQCAMALQGSGKESSVRVSLSY
jgi:hypothetical protein